MVPESQPLSKTLESFISRLLQGVSRSPLLKAFPTQTLKRIDLERLRIITKTARQLTCFVELSKRHLRASLFPKKLTGIL